MTIEKIISGGQTGADQGGLMAGKSLNIPTGGTAPPGYITDDGPRRLMLELYGLVEGEPDIKIYPKRTVKNVRDSDGTVWFGEPYSPGGKLTLNTCVRLTKPFIVNPTPESLKEWIEANNIHILNVAGNRERRNPGVGKLAFNTLVDALKEKQIG